MSLILVSLCFLCDELLPRFCLLSVCMRSMLMIAACACSNAAAAAAAGASVTNCYYCQQLWDVEAGSVISTLTRHEDPVYSVAFSPR
jgi:hypothetical protein